MADSTASRADEQMARERRTETARMGMLSEMGSSEQCSDDTVGRTPTFAGVDEHQGATWIMIA